MDKPKIALISTVINDELYQKSSLLFPKNIQKYVIKGKNGMHGLDSIFFMMKKLKDKDIDWLIMADEDVLFLNSIGIYDVIENMEKNNYTLCGVRDGGVIPNRTYSPYLINTFFSIINFKELKSIWNKKEVLKNQYILDNEFDDDLLDLKGKYDVKSLYEPYFCFYFWLKRKGKKILFLDANAPFEDQITTLVFDTNQNELLYHTWYARSYGNNKKHTERIDKIFELVNFNLGQNIAPVIFKDRTFFIRKFIRKLSKRVEMKLQIIFK